MNQPTRTCSIDGCARTFRARGYCETHYRRWRRTGNPGGPELTSAKVKQCSANACTRTHYGRGYCFAHYQRAHKGGSVESSKVRPYPARGPSGQRLNHHGWNQVQRHESLNPCWEWGGYVMPQGYGLLYVGGRTRRVHRVAFEEWVGPIPDGMIVRHKCDNPPCINPDHLELGTHADNARDRTQRDRSLRGESNPGCTISDADVAAIRSRFSEGNVSRSELAKDFGIHLSTVCRIINGNVRA